MPYPGWYPEPGATGTQRYWDGEQWTKHHAPLAQRDTGYLLAQVLLAIMVVCIIGLAIILLLASLTST